MSHAAPAGSAFTDRLANAARLVENRLALHLSHTGPTYQGGMYAPPERLSAAMEHAVLSGGKRFRPFLVMESAALFGLSAEAALDTAASLECLHCYSLVHDDLPAMDNDDLRRGRPTVQRMRIRQCAPSSCSPWRGRRGRAAWWAGRRSILRPIS